MIYQIELIKTTLEGSSIATAAGKGTMSGSVFIKIGEEECTHSVNLGRMPCIFLKEVNVDYNFEAEPNHVGTRESSYNIRILVPSFANRNQTQYELLEKIKIASLKALTAAGLGLTNVRENTGVVGQCYIYLSIDFSTQTSYDKDYDEIN